MQSPAFVPVRQSVRDILRRVPRVVLAVSGGLDSMALLDAAAASLSSEGLLVATFDHGTGRAASEARAFVEARCGALGISCVSERATGRLTTEAALRETRWAFLRAVAKGGGGAAICTAHTADDQIETVLMRVMRGAGARGVAGLYAETRVVRPLLSFRRSELARYVSDQGLAWVEDPSNADRRFFRNRVRHDLLPALRRVRPSIDGELLELARNAASWRAQVEAFVASHVVPWEADDISPTALDVPVATLADYDAASLAVLWPAIAARAGIALDRHGTERLAAFCASARQPGSRIQLAGGWEVVRSRHAFQLRASGSQPLDWAHRTTSSVTALSKEHATSWDAGAARWSFRLSGSEAGRDSWSAWLPADRPLWVRAWRAGDSMVWRDGFPPRKVKRFLTDAGVSGHERPSWPVVLAGDQIVWIPGVRRSTAATARSGEAGLAFACDYRR